VEQAVWVRWGRAADGFPASVGPAWPFLRSCCAHMHGVGMHAGKNAFSLCCCGLCVFKVCALGSLNSCAHVGMRGSCRRARANRTMPPPTRVVMTCSSSFPRMVFILFASHDVIMTIVTNGGRASRRD